MFYNGAASIQCSADKSEKKTSLKYILENSLSPERRNFT